MNKKELNFLKKLESLKSYEDSKVFFNYVSTYQSYEFGYLDSISYCSSIENYSGKEIAYLIRISSDLYYRGTEEQLNLLTSNNSVSDLIRTIVYNVYQKYVSVQYEKMQLYFKLDKALRN